MLRASICALAVLVSSGACAFTQSINQDELPVRYAVKSVGDLVYRPLAQDEEAARNKNKLDLYLPEGAHDFPVMLFIHGGAWVFGDKNQLGLYQHFASYWAKRGIGVVVANYRLSPGVTHPAHVQDVAKAFAWTRANIGRYGGDAKQIFVSGQSAGGHLVSLLATDETYLEAEGAKISDIKGVLTLSGVYTLPARIAAALPGVGGIPNGRDAVQARRAPFSSVFGNDPKIVRAAAPISHIHAGLPPFLVLYAQGDPKLLREMAVEFAGALEKQKQPVELVEAVDRNHISEIVLLGQKGDPVARAMTSFVKKHAKLP